MRWLDHRVAHFRQRGFADSARFDLTPVSYNRIPEDVGHGFQLERVCHIGCNSLVPRPHPQKEEGSGDIGADSWFCKLSNHVIGLYWSKCGHVMVRKTKKRPAMSPDPFLACVVGSGNETIYANATQVNPLSQQKNNTLRMMRDNKMHVSRKS